MNEITYANNICEELFAEIDKHQKESIKYNQQASSAWHKDSNKWIVFWGYIQDKDTKWNSDECMRILSTKIEFSFNKNLEKHCEYEVYEMV